MGISANHGCYFQGTSAMVDSHSKHALLLHPFVRQRGPTLASWTISLLPQLDYWTPHIQQWLCTLFTLIHLFTGNPCNPEPPLFCCNSLALLLLSKQWAASREKKGERERETQFSKGYWKGRERTWWAFEHWNLVLVSLLLSTGQMRWITTPRSRTSQNWTPKLLSQFQRINNRQENLVGACWACGRGRGGHGFGPRPKVGMVM